MHNIHVRLAVPQPAVSATITQRLFGKKAASVLSFVSAANQEKEAMPFPRPIDVGTFHFAISTQKIHDSIRQLEQCTELNVLGEVQKISSGPLETFEWCWLRMGWGSYFEVQQWGTKDPQTEAQINLHHEREIDHTASIPGLGGLDHLGFVVNDLSAMVRLATTEWGGTKILETHITAESDFMKAQFELSAEVAMKMAMIRIEDINLEFFQHDIVSGLEDDPQKTYTPASDSLGAATLILPQASSDSIQKAHQLGLLVARSTKNVTDSRIIFS